VGVVGGAGTVGVKVGLKPAPIVVGVGGLGVRGSGVGVTVAGARLAAGLATAAGLSDLASPPPRKATAMTAMPAPASSANADTAMITERDVTVPSP
jgi:hypothetical protein